MNTETLTVTMTDALVGPSALVRLAEIFDAAGHQKLARVLRESGDRLVAQGPGQGLSTLVAEVIAEREAQIEQWGVQDYPSVDPVLLARAGGCSPERMAEEYEMPSEERAKFLCRTAFERGQGTYAHVAVEELAEVICAPTDAARRGELVQLAAVCHGWIQAIDRRAAEGGVA